MAKEIRLLSFALTKINAEKDQDFKGQIEINSSMNIENIAKQKLDLVKEDALKINFNFSVNYSDLGKVEMKGEMMITSEPKLLKEVLSGWNAKEKKVQDDFREILFNIILQRCSLKAMQIEENINLPLHMQMPSVRLPPKNQP